jgi:uncharacterized protein
MQQHGYRQELIEFIRAEAQPPDKFSHQPRLYGLARRLAGDQPFDDDLLFAAAWLHDLGVFVGHRPEEPAALAAWDSVGYATREAPGVLERIGFPREKIPAVTELIRTHQPAATPASFEATLLRDADILEQLGAVAVLRTVSKVGRDTRFARFSDALGLLRRNVEELPGQLRLVAARRLAEPRVQAIRVFLAAAEAEADGVEW